MVRRKRDTAAVLLAVGALLATMLNVLVNLASAGKRLSVLLADIKAVPQTWIAIAAVTVLIAVVTIATAKRQHRPARTRALSPIEMRYLQQLTRALDAELTGLDPAPRAVVNLAGRVFDPRPKDLSPRYRIWAESEGVTSPPGRSRTTRNIIGFLLRSDVPVVLLGDPGSGKTVSLQRMARHFIRDATRGRSDLLPVYLRLSEFTAPVTPDEGTHLTICRDFVRSRLAGMSAPSSSLADHVDEYLGEGRLVLLLDAMDEMPREDYGIRLRVLEKMPDLSQKVVFACRKLDFRPSFPFRRCELMQLDPPQARRMLRRHLGRQRATDLWRGVLSGEPEVRELTSNPFFLRLLAQSFHDRGELPRSRAQLMQDSHRMTVERAIRRENAPVALRRLGYDTAETVVSLVLARLAYLLTLTGHGVAITTSEFHARFWPDSPTDHEAELINLNWGTISTVLEVAASERLLRVDTETADAGRLPETLAFSHHRFQEYYCAIYLSRLDGPDDWRNRWDDIWWQEILVMLVGISDRPDQYISALLDSLPPQALSTAVLGSALHECSGWNRAAAVSKLVDRDPTDFYGLAGRLRLLLYGGPPTPEAVDAAFRRLGLIADQIPLTLENLSPEPNDDPEQERVRRWLEERTSTLLDRIELATTCARSTKGSLAQEVAERVTPLLKAVVADGTEWEAVRAIKVSAQVDGTGPAEVAPWSRFQLINVRCGRGSKGVGEPSKRASVGRELLLNQV